MKNSQPGHRGSFRSTATMLCLALAQFASVAHAQASLTGVVRDSAGRAISGAEVSIEALSRIAHTDDLGRYAIADVAPGMRLVRVRRLGFVAFSRMMQVLPGDNMIGDFVLAPVAVELDTVTTRDQMTALRGLVAGYLERKRTNYRGYFRDSTTLGRSNDLSGMFIDMPSVSYYTPIGGGIDLIMTSSIKGLSSINQPLATRCHASIWVDRVQVRESRPVVGSGFGRPLQDEGTILATLRPQDIAAIEVYLSSDATPPQFGGGSIAKPAEPGRPEHPLCGTVVIWTKRGWP